MQQRLRVSKLIHPWFTPTLDVIRVPITTYRYENGFKSAKEPKKAEDLERSND